MIFYLKFLILVLLLMLLCECVVGKNENSSFKRRRSTRDKITDITRTLTDEEIEMALSDLTLADLSALSRLIDTANDAEYVEAQNSFIQSNEHPHLFEESKNGDSENLDYDENVSQQIAAAFPEALSVSDMKLTSEALATFQNENARAKREDSNKDEGSKVDEEYLKLLENSFPHGAEQNEHVDSAIKKDHIRVKRN